MKEFIKKQQFNYIKRCLNDLNNAFRNCVDVNIVETTKLCCQDKIVSQFESLSLAQREILNIGKINEPLQIEPFLKAMDKYVYGMNKLTKADINKVFKKEKKLKLPDLDSDAKVVYTGWIDESTKKLFIVYNLDGKFLGMACRLAKTTKKSSNICAICNRMGSEREVEFLSPICKPLSEEDYKSLGFYICLDSKECNERIESVEKLEDILKVVNRIK